MEFVEGETLAQILARLTAAAGNETAKESVQMSTSMLLAKSAPINLLAATEDEEGGGQVDTKAQETSRGSNVAYYYNLAHGFSCVAEGLQHAHSKGIIHRDIKPSNLILDRQGRLRILDFGLAHVEGQESLTTASGIVGTPLYMSPEQTMARRIPIDHRTDIYSLGATLYEMLAWRPPFKGKDVRDTLSQIIERAPQPPRKLNARVPRDLETITLKCLAKDPAERYGTAEALGQDLRRFVRGDPIEARPESSWQSWSRRLWRHRAGLGLAALFLVLVAGGLAISSILIWREKLRTEGMFREMKVQREKAGRNFGYARRAVDAMLTQVGANALLNVPGLEDVRRKLLERALTFYAEFLEEEGDEPASHRELGEAQLQMGDILDMLGRNAEAETAYREAIALFGGQGGDPAAAAELCQGLGRAHRSLANILAKEGRAEEAKGSLDKAAALFETLVAQSPADPPSVEGLAMTLQESAGLLEREGKHAEAERAYRRAIELRGRLLGVIPKDMAIATAQSTCLRSLSSLLLTTGDIEGEEEGLRQAVAIMESLDEETRKRLEARIEMAALFHTLGCSSGSKMKSREPDLRKALDILRPLAADFPHVPDYRKRLARVCGMLAMTVLDRAEAIGFHEECLRLFRQLSSAFPEVPAHREGLGGTLNNQGSWFLRRSEKEPARAAFREAIAVYDQLVRDFPGVPDYGNILAMFRNNLAMMLWQDGANAEALVEYGEALAQLRKLGEAFPRVHEYQANQARLGNNLGLVLTALGRLEEAERAYVQAIAIQDGLAERLPTVGGYRDVLTNNLLNLGDVLVKMGRLQEAEKPFERGLGILRGLVAANPEQPLDREELACHLGDVAGAWSSVGRLAPAADALREMAAQLQWLVERAPENAKFKTWLARDTLNLAMVEWDLGRSEEARKSYQDAVSFVERHDLNDADLESLRASTQALLAGHEERQ